MAALAELQPKPALQRLGAGFDCLDRRVGAAYARLTNWGPARSLGRLLAVLLMTLVLIGKWHALTTLFGANRSATDNLTWTLVLHQLLQLAFVGLWVLLAIVRGPVRTGTARFSGILAALGGTLASSLLVMESNGGLRADLAPVAVLLLLVGMGWAIWSVAVLGRCFSMMPEVRGLVTSGPYRWVRHPVYLGEITAVLGLLLPILSTRNVAVFVLFCALQLWRTRHEEAGLAGTFPEYVEYRRRTARLLPGLW